MRRTPLWLLSVSVFFLFAACATTLQLSPDSRPAYLSDLRAEYLAENPNGAYSDHVRSGQVVKGMDRFGVLASWGYPEKRARQGMVQETWTYVDKDESSGDTVEYVLDFRDGVLQEWQSTRMVTGMTPIRDNPLPPPVTATETGGKPVPQN